ncbi:hypothetical protein BDB01DRAFT_21004 [Pilobolus umbonatus]|nr:hypothetical protein BDB01DRAFT_21004 [Pilobolus umbonatus]
MSHSHDHHDHSNCNHDHGHHGSKDKVVNEELALRQQQADKLAKSIVKLIELSNEHKKVVMSKQVAGTVNKADVEFMMKEMKLSKAEAERILKINNSDLKASVDYVFTH